jgi:hypothetical protein
MEELTRSIALTAEMNGHKLSADLLNCILDDLADYPEEDCLKAVRMVRQKGERVNTANIIKYFKPSKGAHPNPEEAWSIALRALDGENSMVWTKEIVEAWNVARNVQQAGDLVGARRAFILKYEEALKDVLLNGRPAKWLFSVGFNSGDKVDCIARALEDGKINADYAGRVLKGSEIDQLPAADNIKALEAPEAPPSEKNLELVKALRDEYVTKRTEARHKAATEAFLSAKERFGETAMATNQRLYEYAVQTARQRMSEQECQDLGLESILTDVTDKARGIISRAKQSVSQRQGAL